LNKKKTNWVPEICYEEQADGLSSHIPFIAVPQDEKMPHLIYVFESRDTGEVEPGENGEELAVFEMDLHQYADMSILKEKMTLQQYDNVRFALDLEPIAAAVTKGKEITQKVRENL
jgi:hypothetical protein